MKYGGIYNILLFPFGAVNLTKFFDKNMHPIYPQNENNEMRCITSIIVGEAIVFSSAYFSLPTFGFYTRHYCALTFICNACSDILCSPKRGFFI